MWSVTRPYYYPSFTTVLLQLYLTDLDIQEGDDCQFDYIEVCICFVEIVSKVYGEGHDARYSPLTDFDALLIDRMVY